MLVAALRPEIKAADEAYFYSAAFEQDVKMRLRQINSPIPLTYQEEVLPILQRYFTYGYRETEGILERSHRYLPIFEHYLRQYGLPDNLKYLPIVESAMQPNAISGAGAMGLWQLMRNTAESLHLQVNSTVDERKDPIASTQAAVQYLSQLHEQFGDWHLALAAYNCGPGRVERAIALSGKRDFRHIMPFLPKATRRYIPAFVAANYLMQYYSYHDIYPELPDFSWLFTRTTKVFGNVSFLRLEQITGVDRSLIALLNPGYFKSYIPASERGYYLQLPEAGMERWSQYIRDLHGPVAAGPKDWLQSYYVVKSGETWDKIPELLGCTPKQLTDWNALCRQDLYYGQALVVFFDPSELSTP